MFGLCFSSLAKRFAFPLLLMLGLGASSFLSLSSLPTDCPVVILATAKATLPTPCWAGSLLASTAVTFATPITLLLAVASSFASRWCPSSLLRLLAPPGYGICSQGWISIAWCATTTIFSPELGILLANTFLTLGLLYQFLPRKVSTFSACLILCVVLNIKEICQMVKQIYAPFLLLFVRPLTHADQVFNPGGESGHRFPLALLLTA